MPPKHGGEESTSDFYQISRACGLHGWSKANLRHSHRMLEWFGLERIFKDGLVPTHPTWAGIPIRSGFSGPQIIERLFISLP